MNNINSKKAKQKFLFSRAQELKNINSIIYQIWQKAQKKLIQI